ncbi:MAG: hypothetical protein HGA67_02675 [Candidatus Yonathbacteria bacterium]|nr:hypothetical protein [Candidatus Yonathbacteria bacterium]
MTEIAKAHEEFMSKHPKYEHPMISNFRYKMIILDEETRMAVINLHNRYKDLALSEKV